MRVIAASLLCCLAAVAGDTWVQPYCVHDMRAWGFPVPPQATDNLTVFATGLEAGAKYRVVLTYRDGSQAPKSATVDIEANETGVLAPFPVDEAKTAAVVGWSLRKL